MQHGLYVMIDIHGLPGSQVRRIADGKASNGLTQLAFFSSRRMGTTILEDEGIFFGIRNLVT